MPKKGERGWVVHIHPMDDYVYWDDAGPSAGDWTRDPAVRKVGNRNEPDGGKWLPGDPFGPEGKTTPDIIEMLTMHPEKRRKVVRVLGEIQAETR